MEDIISRVNDFLAVAIVVLGAVQTVVVYILPPDKAIKFNIVGKILDFLVRTKSGLSYDRDIKQDN